MAIVFCSACGGETSSHEHSCAHCGADVVAQKSEQGSGFLGHSGVEWATGGIIGLIFLAAALSIYSCSGSDAPPPTAAETRKETLEKHFSAWDGSHRGLTDFIKRSMNDPDSYEHVETRYSDNGSYLTVTTTFRGANAFGGKVLNSMTARTDLRGNVLEILGD
ncbi:hypothetical protein [Panacagrimonas sp.]|uniref:hypothetical protein n=1 Tax=Panacagrimonas sp. TaxID=2480088 RepID=UPI003B52A36F